MSIGSERSEQEKRIDALVLARVKRGMAVLEEQYGADWVERIDLETLDLGNSDRCVLGQVYGDYSIGLEQLDLDETVDEEDDVATVYGFDRDGYGYGLLNDVWRRELAPLVTAEEER